MRIFSKSESKKEISELVNQFEKNISIYKKDGYKEAQLENDFLRPLFECLNWNVGNRGLDPESQVFQLQVTGKTGTDKNKRPDYLVRIPDKDTNVMKSVFFIEAKIPKYDLKTNSAYIRQVYQYAWSTLNSSENPNNQVRLALLTDFEEFRFFDCQDVTPLKQNRAESYNKHIIKDWTYKEYVSRFDELWDLFEYNNVVNGSLEKWYLTSKQLADNRITPDGLFLEDLRKWRLELAKSMYKNDKKLDDYKLTKATLLYINRIIFVKMLADRNIEPDYLTNILNELNKTKKSELKLYELCKNIFKRLDNIYNGSIFAYDELADEIEIDNTVLKNIFSYLEPEKSIYTLAAMPVEIIGNVYELLIAEQIVKKGTSISIVSRYDEKKAGGVYYTPRYIVEYIVDNTLGKKLDECKTPEDVAKIKVLDPSCGSGSFLIVAYQKLLDWHKKYYFSELTKWTKKEKVEKFRNKTDKKIRVISNEEMNFNTIHLSHKLKSDILINNIFGVDIDQQAVLVTKFSLSIKALEDSTHDEVIEDNTLFKIPAIPKLENNIKCGNSLISSDFYLDNRPSLFNEKEKRKINTFDWEKEFPMIFNEQKTEKVVKIKNQFKTHINAASNYIEGAKYHVDKANQYIDELVVHAVKEESPEYNAADDYGFDVIIGNPPYGVIFTDEMKIYLKSNYNYLDSELESYIIFIEKAMRMYKKGGLIGLIVPSNLMTNSRYSIIRKRILQYKINTLIDVGSNVFNTASVDTCIFIIENNQIHNNLIKISQISDKKRFEKLEFKLIEQSQFENADYQIFNIQKNIEDIELENKIQLKTTSLLNYVNFARGIEFGYNSEYTNNKIISKNSRKLIAGRCINRYSLKFENRYIEFDSMDSSNFKSNEIYENEKILVRRIGLNIIAVYDNEKYFNVCDVYNLTSKNKTNLKYILSLLNSKLMSYFLKTKFYNSKKLFPKIPIAYLKKLPIRNIDFSNKTEKSKHDKLVELTEQMLENQKYLQESKSDSDKKMYANICDLLDNQIDNLVYHLYELTVEEIKVVEG